MPVTASDLIGAAGCCDRRSKTGVVSVGTEVRVNQGSNRTSLTSQNRTFQKSRDIVSVDNLYYVK
jgi:hypothetical protein